MTVALFWDIDGTLLTTLKAGQLALQEACRAVIGRDVDFAAIEMRGVPDTEIAARILEHGEHACDDAAIRSFLEIYERHLPSRLGARRGGPMPGVVPVLERLGARTDVMNLLLRQHARGAPAALARAARRWRRQRPTPLLGLRHRAQRLVRPSRSPCGRHRQVGAL